MLSVILRLSSPDVVPAALLLPVSALCCLLLPGQCHWSVSGSPLPLQRLLWSHLGGPAAAPPRPVRHTHTDVLNWFQWFPVSLSPDTWTNVKDVFFVASDRCFLVHLDRYFPVSLDTRDTCSTGLCGLGSAWSPARWSSGTWSCSV